MACYRDSITLRPMSIRPSRAAYSAYGRIQSRDRQRAAHGGGRQGSEVREDRMERQHNQDDNRPKIDERNA